MKLPAHAAAAVPLTATLWLAGAGWGPALAGGLTSIFIDLDHLLDYLLFRKGWRSLPDFFEVSHQSMWEKTYFICHGWETALLVSACAYLFLGRDWGLCLAAGWFWHLALDQITNPVGPGFYFLSYRAGRGFDADSLLKHTDPRRRGGGSVR